MSGWGAPHRDAGWDRPRLRATVLELIASGRLEADGLVTHRMPFAQAADAYDLIDREREATLKVLLAYRERA
jgi:threonine dehydrogenase-like Zn-dependent dehydrogenase